MEKKLVLRYLALGLIFVGLIGSLLFLRSNLIGFLILEYVGESNFSQGTYENTFYNSSGFIQLNATFTFGNYTSQVFDAGSEASWNNISWFSVTPSINYLYGVDGGGDVYKSIDLGSSWSLARENYGRTTDTQEMFSDSNYLYIISNSNREVWRSSNGTT